MQREAALSFHIFLLTMVVCQMRISVKRSGYAVGLCLLQRYGIGAFRSIRQAKSSCVIPKQDPCRLNERNFTIGVCCGILGLLTPTVVPVTSRLTRTAGPVWC